MKALEIKNLHYSYPDGKKALEGIDLSLDKSTRTALIGKNGSGKTTLMLHIAGLLDGEGHISVSGITRSRKTISEIRKRVAFLFSQVEYQFIMPDLINDIILSIPGSSATKEDKIHIAEKWLERFNLSRYAGSNPLDLSSGEIKRAALAGVLAKEPALLLLDEPLNNLDRENSIILIELLKSFSATMLIATHRRFIIEELATHIAVMENGIITSFCEKIEGLKKKAIRDLIF
ncbi:MAG: ABC transporter ATP-binding protein [Spirochaetota bacterium]